MKDSEDWLDVLTYQVTDDKLDHDLGKCRPSAVYKKVIVDGAVENGLPEDYIQRCERVRFDVWSWLWL